MPPSADTRSIAKDIPIVESLDEIVIHLENEGKLMSITSKSDADILAIALPMIDHVLNTSNQKLGLVFDLSNRTRRQPFFTTLNLKREVFGILRKNDTAQIIWGQTSTTADGNYLARYFIKEIDNEIKEVGFLID